MKTPLIAVLALSLAGNALLAVYVLNNGVSKTDAPAPVAAAPGRVPAAASSPSVAETPDEPAAISGELWSQLKPGDDLHAMVQNMRKAGFPAHVIRSVVYHYANELVAARHPLPERPFWKRNAPSPEMMAAVRAQGYERQELLQSLLGEDAQTASTLDRNARLAHYGNLSDEKVNAIAQIEKDYNELRGQAFAARSAGNMRDVMQQQQLLETEKWQDLAAILSPQELEAYEMRNSRAANQLMHNLRSVEVSEDEYSALYRLQKVVDEATPMSGPMGPELMAARLQAQKEMNQQVRSMLGDERYSQYLEGADPTFAGAKSFASRYPTLPPTTAMELYELQSAVQASMMGSRMNGEERARTIAGFNQKLETVLGAELAAEYRKEGPGRIFSVALPGGAVRTMRIDGGN